MDIKKPYILFDIDSIDVIKSEDKPKFEKIKTVNTEVGPNSTINKIYRIEIDLPTNVNNFPSLRCEVRDQYLFVFKEALGYFEINLKDAYEYSTEQAAKAEKLYNKMLEKEKQSNKYL